MDQRKLIDTVVEDSELPIAQRAFILVAGLDHDGEPVFSEKWINIEDLDRPVDAYTKQADIGFVQQGLVVQAMFANFEGDDDDA